MDQIWISIALLSAVYGSAACIPQMFFFVNESMNWTAAQSFCRENYKNLTSIHNMTEIMNLTAILQSKANSSVWISLNLLSTETLGYSLLDKKKLQQKFCVGMKKNGQRFVDECNKTHEFVCYNESNTGTRRFQLINNPKTWHAARCYCRKHYTDLASVRNDTENQDIFHKIWVNPFCDSCKWSNQSESSFSSWCSDSGEHENCTAVKMTDQGCWHDVDCKRKLPFICIRNKLILIKQKMNWLEALRYCRRRHLDLVSVDSEKVQHWVIEVAAKASTQHVWLGLRHVIIVASWFWVTGKPVCYQRWAPETRTGEEDCSLGKRSGAVQSGGEHQWVALPETQKLNFICTTY